MAVKFRKILMLVPCLPDLDILAVSRHMRRDLTFTEDFTTRSLKKKQE